VDFDGNGKHVAVAVKVHVQVYDHVYAEGYVGVGGESTGSLKRVIPV
jgi:hypothetical protein